MFFALLVHVTKRTRLSLVQLTIAINIHDNIYIKLIKKINEFKKKKLTKKRGVV